jgi:pimeloyl-ACP methyl ester carboxylesterase
MSRRRTAVISAAVAAGVITAGAVGAAVRRRHTDEAPHPPIGLLPPNDLGPVPSFDGTALSVRASGDTQAPIVILAHGFSLDQSTWSEVWPLLAERFRTVTFDQRSHGLSAPAAQGDLSLRSIGRDLAAVMDAVAPDQRVVIVGHSMGGIAALALAEQRPELFAERVAGVVFVGASAADLVRGAMGTVASALRPRMGVLTGAPQRMDRLRKAVLRSPGDLSGIVARLTQFGPDASPEIVHHIVALAGRARSEVWTTGLAELMESDFRHAVPRVTAPSLVIVGEHDRVTPPASAVELAGALPDGRLVVLEGVGHMPMLEAPERLAREITTFATAAFAPKRKPRRGRPSEEGAA